MKTVKTILAAVIAISSFNSMAADQWSAIYGDVNNAFHDNGVNVARAQDILSRRAGLNLSVDQVKDMAAKFSSSSITQWDTLQDVAKRYPSHVDEPVIILSSSRSPVVAAQQVAVAKPAVAITSDTPEAKPQSFAANTSQPGVVVKADVKQVEAAEVSTVSKAGSDVEAPNATQDVVAVQASRPGETVKADVKDAVAAPVEVVSKTITDSDTPDVKTTAPVAQANTVAPKADQKLIVSQEAPKQEAPKKSPVNVRVVAATVVYAPTVNQDQIDANSRAIADTSARSQANSQRIGQMEQANNKRFSDIEKQQSNDRKEYRSGIAGSSAIAGLHYVDAKNAVAIGAASFKNEQGYAIGYRHKFSDNAAATLSAAGTSNGDTVVAGSMSIGW